MPRPTRCAGAPPPWTWPASARPSSGLEGAAFPWRTIRGQECSAYWPAGTAAWHVNADIAMAFERYRIVTGDDDRSKRECGLEVLVETARLWLLARPPRPARRLAPRRRHRPRRVHRDRARQRLHQPDGRAQPARRRRRVRPPPRAGRASWASTTEETAAWRDAADAVAHPLRRGAGRAPAVRGLHHLRGVGLRARTPTYPLLLHEPYVRLYPRAGDQAGRPGAGDAVAEPRVHARAEGPQRRLLRARARCATRRCRRARRR